MSFVRFTFHFPISVIFPAFSCPFAICAKCFPILFHG